MDALSSAEEQLLAEDLPLIEQAVKASRKVNKTPHHTRNAHAKAFGFVRGHFVPVKNEAADFRQLLDGANLGVIIRYSHPNFFVLGGKWEYPVYGCSIKIYNKDAPVSAKFPLVNLPVFITNSVSKFLNIHIKANRFFIAAGRNYFVAALKIPALLRAGLSLFWDRELPSILRNMLKVLDIERQFIPTYDFHSIGCFRLGEKVAKIRLKPNFTLPVEKGNDIEQAKLLRDYFQANELSLDFQVQLATDQQKTPVNNLLKMWREKHAPFVTVGKIILMRQDISNHETADYENLSFNPFENDGLLQPVGRMQQVRRKIYNVSIRTRQQLNQKNHHA